MPELFHANCLLFSGKIEKRIYFRVSSAEMLNQVPVVQKMVSLTSSLLTNSLIVVAKVFSNTLLLRSHIFAAKKYQL